MALLTSVFLASTLIDFIGFFIVRDDSIWMLSYLWQCHFLWETFATVNLAEFTPVKTNDQASFNNAVGVVSKSKCFSASGTITVCLLSSSVSLGSNLFTCNGKKIYNHDVQGVISFIMCVLKYPPHPVQGWKFVSN